MCVHVAEQIDHISSLFHKLPGDHTGCIHPALPPTLPRFTLSSHFLHFPPAMLDPLFFHSVLLPSPYPPFLSLSCCASLAVREFLLISSPLINSHLNQSLLFLFNLSPSISSSSSFFYSVTSIWCASFPNFYTAPQPISPRLFFSLSLPLPVHLLYPLCCHLSHFLSLCQCYLAICSLPELPLCPHPHPSHLLSSPCLCLLMGTGGRLRWSILSYSLFWCAYIDRDRGWRTGALGEERAGGGEEGETAQKTLQTDIKNRKT